MSSPSSLSPSSASSLSPLSVSSSPSISSNGDSFYSSSSSFRGIRVSSSPQRQQQQRRRKERTGQGITTWIRTMFVLLSLITVWYNAKNSLYITSTLSFIAFDRQQHQIQQIQQQQQQQQQQQGCAGDNSSTTTTTAISTKEIEKKSSQLQKLQKQRQKRPRHRLGLLTSQTYVISFHSKKVTKTFRNRNLYTGFYGTNYTFLEKEEEDSDNNAVDNDNDNDVIWFQSVNGYDPIVLKEWNDVTTRRTDTNISNFPIITPEMGRSGFVYPFIKTDPYYEQGLENSTNSYFSPHVIGCYESHRQLLTFISKTWNWNNDDGGNNKQQDDDDDDDELVDNDGDKDEDKDEKNDNEDNKDEENNVEQTAVLLPLPPDAIFVFEDDSVCVDDTKQYILNELIPTLPTTWDILYIGGKPFSYLDNDKNNNDDGSENEDNSYVGSIFQTKEERDHFLQEKELCDYSSGGDRRFGDRGGGVLCPIFRQYACEGKFGTSSTGPFGATTATSNTTSRTTFHPNQPYWKTNYILDTHAYVINPKNIQKVIQILNDMVRISNPIDNFRPIDITLADSMNSNSMNSIQAYLPSKGEYCKQVPHDYDNDQKQQEQRQKEQEKEQQEQEERVANKIKTKENNTNANPNPNANSRRSNVASKRIKSKPTMWEGYYHHNDFGVIWEELYFENCPDSYSNGLL